MIFIVYIVEIKKVKTIEVNSDKLLTNKYLGLLTIKGMLDTVYEINLTTIKGIRIRIISALLVHPSPKKIKVRL